MSDNLPRTPSYLATAQVTARLLRIRGLERYTGLSRSTLHRLIRAGEFPPPVRLTRATSAWIVAEVDRWLDQRLAADGRQMRATAPRHLDAEPAATSEPLPRLETPSASRPKRGGGRA